MGSSSAPAVSALAAAAWISNAAARSCGLSVRPAARRLSTVAPNAPASPCVGTLAKALVVSAAAMRQPAMSAAIHRKTRPVRRVRMSLHQVGGDGAADRLGLALYLGSKADCPGARHTGLDLELIDPRLASGQRLDRCRHRRHTGRPHIRLGFKDDGATDRLVVGHVHQADPDDVLAARELG